MSPTEGECWDCEHCRTALVRRADLEFYDKYGRLHLPAVCREVLKAKLESLAKAALLLADSPRTRDTLCALSSMALSSNAFRANFRHYEALIEDVRRLATLTTSEEK